MSLDGGGFRASMVPGNGYGCSTPAGHDPWDFQVVNQTSILAAASSSVDVLEG